MLSRTADHLFWMARYMERAENTARMLDVNYQASLLPQSADEAARELYRSVPNATVRTLESGEDPVQVLAAWAGR